MMRVVQRSPRLARIQTRRTWRSAKTASHAGETGPPRPKIRSAAIQAVQADDQRVVACAVLAGAAGKKQFRVTAGDGEFRESLEDDEADERGGGGVEVSH